ncbi:MAG: hypothetical protein ACREBC_38140, partial [Pyrinomonadaceae bacterium]
MAVSHLAHETSGKPDQVSTGYLLLIVEQWLELGLVVRLAVERGGPTWLQLTGRSGRSGHHPRRRLDLLPPRKSHLVVVT